MKKCELDRCTVTLPDRVLTLNGKCDQGQEQRHEQDDEGDELDDDLWEEGQRESDDCPDECDDGNDQSARPRLANGDLLIRSRRVPSSLRECDLVFMVVVGTVPKGALPLALGAVAPESTTNIRQVAVRVRPIAA